MATISYFLYELTPMSKLNRFEPKKRYGVLFKLDDQGVGYVDYHPWEELGDQSVKDFLENILVNPEDTFFNYLIHLAQKDKERSLNSHKKTLSKKSLIMMPFYNHLLVTPDKLLTDISNSDISNSEGSLQVFKVKLSNDLVRELPLIKEILDQGVRLRIDANSGLNYDQMNFIWNSFTDQQKLLIEYFEDPTVFHHETWTKLRSLGIPIAIDRLPSECFDFVNGAECFDYIVHKPNRYKLPENNSCPIIFSSYMGHDLGRIQCYYELMEQGDLQLIHGIDTPNIYLEQHDLFVLEDQSLYPCLNSFDKVYRSLESLEWSFLCRLT